MATRELHPSILSDLQSQLDGSVAAAARVSGGDIHRAFRVWLGDDRSVFLKTSATTPPGLFRAEAEGLRWLAGFGALRTPEVLAVRDHSAAGPGYLALAWLAPAKVDEQALQRLGRGLAELHSHGQAAPGWHRANYIGPLPQLNGGEALSWPEFWAERRLRALITLPDRRLPAEVTRAVHTVADRCEALIGPDRPLAPLHGDLWSGNVLAHDGEPVLIDPAVYAGDPEVDLAMMALFGGFGPTFWRTYHADLAQEPGWQQRRRLYQLWPLLVHALLFGGGYVRQVHDTARALMG